MTSSTTTDATAAEIDRREFQCLEMLNATTESTTTRSGESENLINVCSCFCGWVDWWAMTLMNGWVKTASRVTTFSFGGQSTIISPDESGRQLVGWSVGRNSEGERQIRTSTAANEIRRHVMCMKTQLKIHQ